MAKKGRKVKINGKTYRLTPAMCTGSEEKRHDPVELVPLYFRPSAFKIPGSYLFTIYKGNDPDRTPKACPECGALWWVKNRPVIE